MKIIPIASLLIITLLIVPLFNVYFGAALSPVAIQSLIAVIAIAALAAFYCFVAGDLDLLLSFLRRSVRKMVELEHHR